MFPTLDKNECLVQEQHHPSPLFNTDIAPLPTSDSNIFLVLQGAF